MLGQNQFYIRTARLAYTRRIGVDHHSFADHVVAGRHKLAFALDLNAAHSAGGYLVDVLQIAQAGNLDPHRGRSVQNGRALGN